MFKQLYKASARPHLEYASVNWNPYYTYQKILTENVQRRATRLLTLSQTSPGFYVSAVEVF